MRDLGLALDVMAKLYRPTKSEARSPKSETNSKSKSRKHETGVTRFVLSSSCLGFVSDFVLRISCFGFPIFSSHDLQDLELHRPPRRLHLHRVADARLHQGLAHGAVDGDGQDVVGRRRR